MDIMSPLPRDASTRIMNRAKRLLPVQAVHQTGPDQVEVVNAKGEHVLSIRRGAAQTAHVEAAIGHLVSLGWDRAQARHEIAGASALTFVNGAFTSHMHGGWADHVAQAIRWRRQLQEG